MGEINMDDEYQKLMKYFKNPKNVGIINNPDGYARVKNPICGDLTDIYIKIEKNRIKQVKFKSFGCLVTIASASALSKAVKDKNLDEIVETINPVETLIGLLMKEFGNLPREKLHCPPAPVHALLLAISDYYKKSNRLDKLKKIDNVLSDIEKYYKK